MGWRAGRVLYRALGRIDAARGVASWSEALAWLASLDEPLDEVQYWGHGTWGRVKVDRDVLGIDELRSGSDLYPLVSAVRARLAPGALFWLRTCEAFGTPAGHAFASALAETLRTPVAGHTYVIGFWQSGLHGLVPGATPSWSPDEGVIRGSSIGRWSTRREPNTISCLHGRVPDAWFSR